MDIALVLIVLVVIAGVIVVVLRGRSSARPAPPASVNRGAAPVQKDDRTVVVPGFEPPPATSYFPPSDDARGGGSAFDPEETAVGSRPLPPTTGAEPPDEFGAVPPPPPPPPAPTLPPMQEAPPVFRGIPADRLDDLLKEEAEAPQPAPPPAPQPAVPAAPAAAPEPVQFSTYYPREIRPMDWQPLVAYLFRESAADVVAADAKQQLGERMDDFRTVGEGARQAITEGATVTATPHLAGFQFNPPSVTVGFFENWHRFDFKLRAKDAPLNLAANGRLTFTVEGVIVADLPLSIFVGETVSASTEPAKATAKPYDAVFCSYSRKDIAIVERVERAYKILGIDYLRDMISIRSGEQWSKALESLIERADIFQLFWSSTSSQSKHVQMEWEYALKLAETREHFIRPVYWEFPMPPAPPALGSINFAYEPTLDD